MEAESTRPWARGEPTPGGAASGASWLHWGPLGKEIREEKATETGNFAHMTHRYKVICEIMRMQVCMCM